MNREDIIRMAREAGAMVLLKSPDRTHVDYQMSPESVERLSALVAAAEREACAKLCEEIGEESDSFTRDILRSTAEVIRARGQACNCAEAIRKKSST